MMAVMLVAACGGPGSAPSPGSKETAEAADFRMICEEAKSVASSGGADDRRTRFAGAVDQKLRTPTVREVWNSAGMAADNEKLSLLRQGAAELKVERWDCPALADIYGPQTAP